MIKSQNMTNFSMVFQETYSSDKFKLNYIIFFGGYIQTSK